MNRKLLTANEVCKLLDLKLARVYELTRQNKIPYVLIGERQYRYNEAALLAWIERGGNKENGNAENIAKN